MRSHVPMLFLLSLAGAACDRVPGDPLENPETAALIERMRHAATGEGPLPSLVELADVAAARTAVEHPLIASYHSLRAAADAAVRTGDRERAETAVAAARDAQLRMVVAGLGAHGVAEVIARGQHRVRRLQPAVVSAVNGASRPGRMTASAADMLQRARALLLQGDILGALDLSAHAIDLLNAVAVLTDQ